MTRLLATITTCLLLLAAAPASLHAEKTGTIHGVTYWSDYVWTDQISGSTVVRLPLGCKASTCEYTIKLAFVAPHQELAVTPWRDGTQDLEELASLSGASLRSADDTPWDDIEAYPSCALWVELGNPVLPMLTMDGRQDGVQVEDYIRVSNPINFWPSQAPLIVHSDRLGTYVGARRQRLTIDEFEIKVVPRNRICGLGITVHYYKDSKSYYDQGLSR